MVLHELHLSVSPFSPWSYFVIWAGLGRYTVLLRLGLGYTVTFLPLSPGCWDTGIHSHVCLQVLDSHPPALVSEYSGIQTSATRPKIFLGFFVNLIFFLCVCVVGKEKDGGPVDSWVWSVLLESLCEEGESHMTGETTWASPGALPSSFVQECEGWRTQVLLEERSRWDCTFFRAHRAPAHPIQHSCIWCPGVFRIMAKASKWLFEEFNRVMFPKILI